MTDCFGPVPDLTAFTHVTNDIALGAGNPTNGPICLLPLKQQYWVQKSMKLDFSKPDRADPYVLSHILWASMKGDQPFPSQYAGESGKGLKSLGLRLINNPKANDDD